MAKDPKYQYWTETNETGCTCEVEKRPCPVHADSYDHYLMHDKITPRDYTVVGDPQGICKRYMKS